MRNTPSFLIIKIPTRVYARGTLKPQFSLFAKAKIEIGDREQTKNVTELGIQFHRLFKSRTVGKSFS
jgi:hypothetical protein